MSGGIQFVEPMLKTPLGPVTLNEFNTLSCDVQYNAISAISLTYPLTKAQNLGLTDQSIVSVRVGFWNGETKDIEQFVMETTDDEKVSDGVRLRTLTGRSSLALLDDAIVYPSNWPVTSPSGHEFIDQTVGTIFRTLILRAKDRGGLLDLNELGFSGTTDSDGVTWGALHSQTYSTGTKYTQVLQEFMDRGYVDAWIDSDFNIHMLNGGTRGEHIDIGTVELRPAANVSEMVTQTNSSESISAVLIEGEAGTAVERTDPSMETTLGRRRERYVQQGGINDAGVLTLLADAELDLYGRIPSEESVGISNSGILPFLDFGVGDWVSVRYQADAVPVERRVRQLAVSVSETREITLGVTLNSILYESDVALARKVEAYTGGGGNYGSTPNTSPDLTVPAPPVSVNITSGYYIDNSGVYQGALVVNWVAPTLNVDGTALSDLEYYEVQYRYVEDAEWNFVMRTSSTETFLGYSPVSPGRTVVARVRAVDSSDHSSAWAESAPTVLETDTIEPPKPSTPVAVSMPGFIQVTWDGKDEDGFNMPADLLHVEVWQSATAVFTPGVGDNAKVGVFTAAGVMQAPGILSGAATYYRFRAVDKAGNLSPLSDADDAMRLPSGSPVEGPDSTPTLQAFGLPTSIVLRSEDVDVPGSTKLTYEVSTDEGATWQELPGCPTTSLIYVVEATPNEGTLVDGATYQFRSIASNEIDAADPSNVVSASLNSSALADVIAEDVLAQFGLFGAVQVGAITIDPVTGITIPFASGVIHFPADGVSPATITAHVIAESLDVQNGATIKGTSMLSGIINLGASIEDPDTAPLVTTSWLTWPFAAQKILSGRSFYSLCRNFDNDAWIFGASDRYVREYDDTNVGSSPNKSVALPSPYVPMGGIVQGHNGGNYYVLAKNTTSTTAAGTWRVYRLNSSDLSVYSSWSPNLPSDTVSAQIALTPDSVNNPFAIVYWRSSSSYPKPFINFYSATGVRDTQMLTLTTLDTTIKKQITGLHVGNADLGFVPNLLRNSSFEYGSPQPNYWGYGGPVGMSVYRETGVSGVSPIHGTVMARMDLPATSSWGDVSQAYVAAKPGVEYTVSGYGRRVSGQADTAGSIRVELRFYNDADTLLATHISGSSAVNDTAWTRTSQTVTSPAGTTKMDFRLAGFGSAGAARSYRFDAAMVNEGSLIAYTDYQWRVTVQYASGVSGDHVRVFNGAGGEVTSDSWDRPHNASVVGLFWDGTYFQSLMANGTLVTYGRQRDKTLTQYFKYAYTNDDNSYHTDVSPEGTWAGSNLWKPRSWALVQANPAPDESGSGPTSANTVRIFSTNVLAGTYYLQSTLVGDRQVLLEFPVTGTDTPDTNNWTLVSTPGEIRSLIGGFWIDGESNGSVGYEGFRDSVVEAVLDGPEFSERYAGTTDLASMGVTVSSGWNVTGWRALRVGPYVRSIQVNVVRTGAALGPGTSVGNMSDTSVMILPVGWRPPTAVPFIWESGGNPWGAGRIGSGGSVFLSGMHANASIDTGDTVNFSVFFLADA